MLRGFYAEEVKALLKPAGEFESVDAPVQAQLQEKFAKRLEALTKK